jgi:hypothetical protein
MSMVDLHTLWASQASSLAQLITDNNAPAYISYEQRAAEWWQERADEADAVRSKLCSRCGHGLRALDREYLRCDDCGHLARIAIPRVRKAYSRMECRPRCTICKRRRLAHLVIDGICVSCSA